MNIDDAWVLAQTKVAAAKEIAKMSIRIKEIKDNMFSEIPEEMTPAFDLWLHFQSSIERLRVLSDALLKPIQ